MALCRTLPHSVALRRTLSFSAPPQTHRGAGRCQLPCVLRRAEELLLLRGLLGGLLCSLLLCSLFLGSHCTSSYQGGSFPGDSPVNRWVSPPRYHDGNSCTAPKGALSNVASVLQKQRARDRRTDHHHNRRTSNLPTRLFKDSNRASTTATILFGAHSRSGVSPRRARAPSQTHRRAHSPASPRAFIRIAARARYCVFDDSPLKMSPPRHGATRITRAPIAIRRHTAKLYRVVFPERMTECLR